MNEFRTGEHTYLSYVSLRHIKQICAHFLREIGRSQILFGGKFVSVD